MVRHLYIPEVRCLKDSFDDTENPIYNSFDLNSLIANSLLETFNFLIMPFTRKQKAKEKRSRQSDVMSDIENLDVMLGARSVSHTENNFRSLLNTNPSEN